MAVPEGPLHAEVVPVAAAELLLVADVLYGVRPDRVRVDVRAARPGHFRRLLADRRDDPVRDGRLGEAAGVDGRALQHAQAALDRHDDVPAAEGVELLVRIGGDQLLGQLPAAPPRAHAEYALGAGVEDRVGPLLRAEAGQLLAHLLGRVARVARNGFGDLGAHAAARQQARPALPQVTGRPLADLLGPEPADDRHDDRRAPVQGPESREGHFDQEQHGERAHRDQQGRGEGAGALVLALGHGGAQREHQQPHEEARQEEHPADDRDRREPVVSVAADAVGRQAVLHDDLGFDAEGLDDGVAPRTQHPVDDGAGKGLAEPGTEDLRPGARRFHLGLVPLVVGVQDLGDLVVPVRRRGQCVGRRRLPSRTRQRHLGPWAEVESVCHCRPHRCRIRICGLPDFRAPHTC